MYGGTHRCFGGRFEATIGGVVRWACLEVTGRFWWELAREPEFTFEDVKDLLAVMHQRYKRSSL